MSYEKLSREREELLREVKSADSIAREDFYLSVRRSNDGAAIGLCGINNRNHKATELELEALDTIKQALLKYVQPKRDRIAIIDKKLAAANELLRE